MPEADGAAPPSPPTAPVRGADQEYESDGGWSDDSGKDDSDAYVPSRRSERGRRGPPPPTAAATTAVGTNGDAAVFDATTRPGRFPRRGGTAHRVPRKRAGRALTELLGTFRRDEPPAGPAIDDWGSTEAAANDEEAQRPPKQPLPPDLAAQAALAAGHAAAAYDNDRTAARERLEREQQLARQWGPSTPSNKSSAAPGPALVPSTDDRTLRSTELTEAERQRRRVTVTWLAAGLVLTLVLLAGVVGGVLGATLSVRHRRV